MMINFYNYLKIKELVDFFNKALEISNPIKDL